MMSEEHQRTLLQFQEAVKRYRRIDELLGPGWTEGSILANGIHQHYYRTGGDKPALVLLHGIQESGLCWLRVAKALADDYDVIMLDARGHGRSDGVASGFSPEQLIEDAAGAIRALGLARPALLGHSMGAATAAQVAAAYPDLARAILLEDPPWREAPRGAQIASSEGYLTWLNSWIAWLEQLRTQTHEERLVSALAQLPPGMPLPSEDEYVPWVEACARLDLELVRMAPALWARESLPWRELAPRITCPVLLMTGNPQPARGFPAIVTPQDAQEIAAACPNVQVAYFEEAGHLLHRGMTPAAFTRFIGVVKRFLSEQ